MIRGWGTLAKAGVATREKKKTHNATGKLIVGVAERRAATDDFVDQLIELRVIAIFMSDHQWDHAGVCCWPGMRWRRLRLIARRITGPHTGGCMRTTTTGQRPEGGCPPRGGNASKQHHWLHCRTRREIREDARPIAVLLQLLFSRLRSIEDRVFSAPAHVRFNAVASTSTAALPADEDAVELPPNIHHKRKNTQRAMQPTVIHQSRDFFRRI